MRTKRETGSGLSRGGRGATGGALLLAGCGILTFILPACGQNAPRIGYVFPAGGKAGSTFEVAVGGQFIENATNAVFSGPGIRATVVDFHKPMPQGMFNTLRDKMRELQEKKQAWNRASRQGQRPPAGSTNAWTTADEKQLEEIQEKILKNPPNRNATPAIAEVATLRVTIEAGAEEGDREIRLGTPVAFSNPLKFQVGHLPEISREPARPPNPDADRIRQQFRRVTNAAPTRPEIRVAAPAVINGQIMPGIVDRYRFRARRGQEIVIAASARDLIPYIADAVPGWFQAVLTLQDSKGREIAYNDDFRFHPDPVIHCTIPSDGDYVLEIKDAIYRGREDFVYRITLGEIPFITGIHPLGCRKGSTAEIEVHGWNLPTEGLHTAATQSPSGSGKSGNGSAGCRLILNTDELAEGINFISITDGTNLLGAAPFAVDSLPEGVEREPNDTPRGAQSAQAPVILNGRIGKPGDVDVFRISGKAGQMVVAEVMARRLDSPLDSILKLTDASGKPVAANDDNEDKASGLNTHHADSRIAVALPADGEYFLTLADIQGKGGAEYGYRLRISPPQPDFALRLAPSTVNLRGSGSPITVFALRRDGFTNDITLALKDPPPGFTLAGGKIPAGQDQVKVTLSAPAVPGDERFHLEIEGRATIGERAVIRPAVPADDLMQAFFYRHLVPAKEFHVAIAGRFGQRGGVKILSPTPLTIPMGGTARIKVGIPRGPFMDRIQFEMGDAPEGIAITSVTPVREGMELVLQCDATKLKPNTEGNLIINAYMPRAGDSGRGRPAANRQRNPVGTLPAIPFKVAPAPI